MILQVHDELVFDVPQAEVPIFEVLIRECMEGVLLTHHTKMIREYREK